MKHSYLRSAMVTVLTVSVVCILFLNATAKPNNSTTSNSQNAIKSGDSDSHSNNSTSVSRKCDTSSASKSKNVIVGCVMVPDREPPRKPGEEDDDKEGIVGISSIDVEEPKHEFDDKAAQRAFIVIGILGLMIVVYFAIKFSISKKRTSTRYGLVESSEMDLLDNMDGESEDDTLFEVRTSDRS